MITLAQATGHTPDGILEMTYGEILQLQLAVKRLAEIQEKEFERVQKAGKKPARLDSMGKSNLRKRG